MAAYEMPSKRWTKAEGRETLSKHLIKQKEQEMMLHFGHHGAYSNREWLS